MAMTSSVRESVRDLVAYDDARPSAPFEHGLVALAGLGLLAGACLSASRGRAVCQAALAVRCWCVPPPGRTGCANGPAPRAAGRWTW